MNRKVRAFHLILTTYGFWLPNDLCGSWSDFVRAWELYWFGGFVMKVSTRHSLARDPHDRARRKRAKEHLAREPVSFTGLQAKLIGDAFAGYAKRSQVVIHACAILPEHIHLVIGRHRRLTIEQIANQLKGAATRMIQTYDLHPFADQPYRDGSFPTPWARKWWKCFLWDEPEIVRASDYANDNPEKDGLPRQEWSFVTPFVA